MAGHPMLCQVCFCFVYEEKLVTLLYRIGSNRSLSQGLETPIGWQEIHSVGRYGGFLVKDGQPLQ
jgi:hypothetical protein